MLVLDFMVKCRLDEISVESMECLDAFCTLRVGTIKLLLAPDCSASSMSFMDLVLILKETIN